MSERREPVDFYFDFVSPYVWLALRRAEAFAEAQAIRWIPRPVVYAALLDHWRLVGPAETSVKRRYTMLDVARLARQAGHRVEGPPQHPFRSIEALRTLILYRDDPRAMTLAVRISDACWADGRDLTDVRVLAEVVTDLGLDGADLAERIRTPAVKQGLHEQTSRAIACGVFGVPTLVWRDEPFWGHDRLDQLAARISGRLADPRPIADRMSGRPAGATRRGKG